jgi:hypothetical protein
MLAHYDQPDKHVMIHKWKAKPLQEALGVG